MMNRIAFTLCSVLVIATSASALAKTKTGSISVTTQIVPGNTVSAYLTRGDITTTVSPEGIVPAIPSGAVPIVRVDFNLEHSWALVKRVTWDKSRHHLTIDL